MGAMKALMIDASSMVYDISNDLKQASETSDLDEMRSVLRRTIVSAVLAIATIDELENM